MTDGAAYQAISACFRDPGSATNLDRFLALLATVELPDRPSGIDTHERSAG